MPISDPLKLQAELESIVTTIEKATFSQVKTINQNGGIRVALDKLIKDCKCGVVDGELLEFLKDAMEANGIQFY